MQQTKSQILYTNSLINKRQLNNLMYEAFLNYGVVKSALVADRVKNLTFHYATKSGISLSIEDLRVPYKKLELLGLTNNEVYLTKQKYDVGNITSIERFQKTIDIWNNANNFLKDEVLNYFRESDPLNPLYIMAFSGARGNISQVRQLVGMRGLMADPQGQIIDLPIRSNFREGLSVTEYIISSYGARKGLVDTALRTADSGYLTRRLVDVAQDIIIREEDCGTKGGLFTTEFDNKDKINSSRLIGRILAEDLFDKNGLLLAKKGDELTTSIVKKIDILTYRNLKIRSPLICKSIRSVCRKCYGWHLAYSRLVDLGEAVGIIAAQSIGEPGTQLTMRTFHTGGVFSGDLTYQVRAPFSGRIVYNPDIKALLFKTLHGEMGFRVSEKMTIILQNSEKHFASFNIPKGGVLLVNSGEKVYTGEIIAEIKKEADILLEEEQKDIFAQESGELYFLNNGLLNPIHKKIESSESNLLWVLNGTIYRLPNTRTFNLEPGTFLTRNTILSQTPITNTYSGIVNLKTYSESATFTILHHRLKIANLIGQKERGENAYKFTLTHDKGTAMFMLKAPLNKPLQSGATLAVLIDDTYKTETGGIITYSLAESNNHKNKKKLRQIFSGSFYWIPEETFEIKDAYFLNSLKVQNGVFIEPGAEIVPGVFSKKGGLVHINYIEKKIIVKPGELVKIEDNLNNKTNRFIKAGEIIIPNRLISQSLVYVEFFKIFNLSYLLVRPVQIYKIPKAKPFSLENFFFPDPNSKKSIRIKASKKLYYKNWETIQSDKGVNLVKTFLILNTKFNAPNLQTHASLVDFKEKDKQKYLFQISLFEIIKMENYSTRNLSKNLKVQLRSLVKNKQYIQSNTPLAYFEVMLENPGILGVVGLTNTNEKELLIIENKHLKSVAYNARQNLKVKKGDLIRIGTYLTNDIKSPYNGQIYKILEDQILIRIGQPYLISSGTVLRVKNGSLIHAGDTLATLAYKRLKTTDIVQGLPKVEEVLEARKIKNPALLAPCFGYVYFRPKTSTIEIITINDEHFSLFAGPTNKIRFTNGQYVELSEPLTDGIICPHHKLSILFSWFKTKYPISEACSKSVKSLQLFLINEIQNTYLNQGVQIADKHIEVIVRQMTSKVCIEDPGNTTFLPGEIIEFRKVNAINNLAFKQEEVSITYRPILLGITKASLNSDSFISAASFQETTRVLTEAAIEGRKDWLNGLKENVIIGRLIPAGTGFSYNENKEMLEREKKDLVQSVYANELSTI